MTHGGMMAVAGVALVLCGVATSAVAGKLRERTQGETRSGERKFGPGLAMAVTSGVCASMMNVGFAYGAPLAAAAAQNGAGSLWQTDAIWVPLMAGGALPNVAYCAYLLTKRGTGASFRSGAAGRNVSLAMAMALLWFGSSVVYGIATALLGELGPVVGWPVFMSLIVIVASVLGVWTGEWKRASAGALRMQWAAVALLVVAVVVLSRATF